MSVSSRKIPVVYLVIFLLLLGLPRVALPYGGNFDAVSKSLGDLKNTSFFVTSITFSADIPFGSDEFFYLTQLAENTFLNKESILQAYKKLMAKKRFSGIDIDMTEIKGGKHIHFTLYASWILKKVEIDGILFGKYEYENVYTQQAGDIFDERLHEDSLKNVRHFLHTQGYFDASLRDELVYSKKYKAITVKIIVNRGKKYTVRSSSATLSPQAPKKGMDAIEHELSQFFSQSLIKYTYSQELVEKLAGKLKRYLKKEGYPGAQIKLKKEFHRDTAQVSLFFSVIPGKRKIITFRGNSLFTTTYFLETVIGDDQPDWLFSPDIITEQISHEYYKKGYWSTEVTYKQPTPDSYLFTINEGPQIALDAIEIKEGSRYLSEETSYFWQKILAHKSFDYDQLEDAIQQLKDFYIANGFWDFALVDRQYIKTQIETHYKLVLFINKGEQRFWGGITITGYESLLATPFFKKYTDVNADQLVPFDNNWLVEQKDYLMAHFQALGYWFASIEPEVITIPWDNTHAQTPPSHAIKQRVVWHIKPGECVTFGSIVVRGNTRLPFDRILREIKFNENDVWDREKLSLTRKKLKRLDVFKQVQVQPYQSTQQTYKKPIVITLTDDDPVEVRLRAGYYLTSKNFMFKQDSTPKVGATIAIKNPTNRADCLTFETDITKFDRKINGEYRQPSFMNLPAIAKVKGYANKYVHPIRIGSGDSAYEASQTGFLFGLNEEYKDDYYWGITFGSEWVKTSRVRGNLNLDPSMIDKTQAYLFVEPSIIIDKLDDKINTTEGSFSLFAFKAMAPQNGGSFTARALMEQSLFYPLGNNMVAAMRFRFGHILRRSFEFIMPIERFYLGGPSSVRSYEKDAVPPLGATTLHDGSTAYTIQGGSSMFNANLELRFPVYGSLNGVVFQDIGTLSQSGIFGLTKTWYPGTGFGLRFKTPIGSLRFDIGWKWKKRFAGDLPYAFHLTLGEAF